MSNIQQQAVYQL